MDEQVEPRADGVGALIDDMLAAADEVETLGESLAATLEKHGADCAAELRRKAWALHQRLYPETPAPAPRRNGVARACLDVASIPSDGFEV